MRQLKISNSITTRESESLEKYLREIARVDLLSPEEEAELFSLVNEGDKKALEKLTKANLRFVVSVAKQYQHLGLSLPDLINEGNIGLIEATRKFDPSRGFKFISYAVWWIRQNILRTLANDADLIRLPYNKKLLGRRIQKVNDLLEQSLQRPASDEELAEVLEIDPREVASHITIQQKCVSLDSPLQDNEENSLLDVLENPDGKNSYENISFTSSMKTELDRVMHVLSQRQKETLCYYFGINTKYPMSLDEIAQKYNLTTERVRQIKDKAISLLRTAESYRVLRNYIGGNL